MASPDNTATAAAAAAASICDGVKQLNRWRPVQWSRLYCGDINERHCWPAQAFIHTLLSLAAIQAAVIHCQYTRRLAYCI